MYLCDHGISKISLFCTSLDLELCTLSALCATWFENLWITGSINMHWMAICLSEIKPVVFFIIMTIP